MAEHDLESRLRHGLAARAAATAADDPTRLAAIDRTLADHRRHQAQRRHLLVGAAAAATMTAGGGALWWATGRDDRPEDDVRTTDDGPDGRPSPGGTGPSSVPSGWRVIDPAPLADRTGAAVVAIPGGLVVWGGDGRAENRSAQDHLTDGARWDAETGRWTALAPVPFDSGLHDSPPIAVWTGSEVVMGPIEPALIDTRASADYSLSLFAYDPAADSWRQIELPSPLAFPGQGPVAFGFAHPVVTATTDGRVLAVTRDPWFGEEGYEPLGPGCPTVLVDPADGTGRDLGRFPTDPLVLTLAPAGDLVAALAIELGPADGYGELTLHWIDLTSDEPVWEGGVDLGWFDHGGRADGPWWDGERLLVQRAPGHLVAVDPAAAAPAAIDLRGPVDQPLLAGGPWVWAGEVARSARMTVDPRGPDGPVWIEVPQAPSEGTDPEVLLPLEFAADQVWWNGTDLLQYGMVPCPDNARCLASSFLAGRAYRP